MFLGNRIENREKQERHSLADALAGLGEAMGMRVRIRRYRDSEGHAIKDLLNHLKIDNYSLEDDLRTPEDLLEDILVRNNVMKRQVVLEGDWWRNAVGPYLGRDREGHTVALLPLRFRRGYYYISIEGEKVVVNRKVMREKLQKEAVSYFPGLPTRKLNYKDLIRFVWSGISAGDIVRLVLTAAVVSLFGLFAPFINKQLFDDVIPNGSHELIIPLAGLLIGAGVGQILFGVTRDLMLTRMKDVVNVTVQPAVMARTFALRTKFFWKYSSGELNSRITSINTLCELLNDTIMSSMLTLIFSVVYIAQMVTYSGELTLPALAVLAAQFLLMISAFWMQKNYHGFLLSAKARLSGLVFNIFSGVQKIKLTASENRGLVRWMKEYTPTVDIHRQPMLLRIYPTLSATIQLGGTAVLYYFALRSELSPSDFIAFNVAYGLVNGAVMSLAGIIPSLAQVNPLLNMASPIMEAEPEIDQASTTVDFLSGAIEVNNLSFRYAQDLPLVIDGLNLNIRPGEYVGVVGKSGCGKSTLLRLLLGFETPVSGSIYYDDYDLQKVDKQSLRRRIGTCMQNASLFPGNIFSNITITNPSATEEEAWEAAELADIAEDIRELPMGMHTLVVEGGGSFSGGQKQRLLIARALMNKPSIVLFDEATSALDNISQKQVSDNLDKMGCTRIVIAHRLSTIRNCDRIIVLDKGRIVEEGGFGELMDRKGVFYELSKRQM